MKRAVVVGIGELLWDMLPQGKQPGGAPCNFVFHAQQLGAEGIVVSAVGNDTAGDEIIEAVRQKGLSFGCIQRNDYATGRVDVQLDQTGVPTYVIHENVAWDHIRPTDRLKEEVSRADILCFGSLAQRNNESHQTLQSLLSNTSNDCLRVFDINLRQHYYQKETIENSLDFAHVLKMNDDELPVLVEMFNLSGDVSASIRSLMTRFNIDLVAYTQGAKGSCLYTQNEESHLATPSVEVKDTIGAGDSFTAAMVMSMYAHSPLGEIHARAVRLSAWVCTQDGAMPMGSEI